MSFWLRMSGLSSKVSFLLLPLIVVNVNAFIQSTQSLELQMENSPFGSIDAYTNETRSSERRISVSERCTICGNLNVPFLPNEVLPFADGRTCKEMEDITFSFIPKTDAACNEARRFEPYCCDERSLIPRYHSEDNVRKILFDSGTYNVRTAPIPQETRQLEILTFITHWMVEKVDVTTSTAKTFVQVELVWNDPRLRWNASDESTSISYLDVYASHDPEKTNIWVPVRLSTMYW